MSVSSAVPEAAARVGRPPLAEVPHARPGEERHLTRGRVHMLGAAGGMLVFNIPPAAPAASRKVFSCGRKRESPIANSGDSIYSAGSIQFVMRAFLYRPRGTASLNLFHWRAFSRAVYAHCKNGTLK